MINNLNNTAIPENSPRLDQSADSNGEATAAPGAYETSTAHSPFAFVAQRTATAIFTYAPQVLRPILQSPWLQNTTAQQPSLLHQSLTRVGQSSRSLGLMAQQHSTQMLEITQPSPYLGDRRYPLIQIQTGNASQKAESSQKITDMLIQVRKAYVADRRNRDIEIDLNYQSSEFTFFTHQFNLALQLDPSNPALNDIFSQLSEREIGLMPLIMKPPRRAAQACAPRAIPQAIPQSTPPANPRGRPPITPPPRANTRPLTTPPSGPLANPESKRVKAEESNAV
ncbi:MAG: hypothetical protein QE278_02770 [Limnobacter sp.]|nr:hypothetical protein [Limnobacter sp.]